MTIAASLAASAKMDQSAWKQNRLLIRVCAMPLSAEDDFCDIIKKARMGQAWSVEDVARVTGLPGADITALERGDRAARSGGSTRPCDHVRASSRSVGTDCLRSGFLNRYRRSRWIETIQGDINGYAVHGYIVHDSGEALLVDTAYNAPAMIAWLESHRLRLTGICLTHGHADHAEGIQALLARWQVPVYLGADDVSLLHWKPSEDRLTAPNDGRAISVGRLARPLSRHARPYAWRDLLSCGCRVTARLFRRRYVVCGIHWPLESQYVVSDPSAIGPDQRAWVAA